MFRRPKKVGNLRSKNLVESTLTNESDDEDTK